MSTLLFPQLYDLLRSQGLTPSAAAVALYRAHPDKLEWISRWLAMKSPDRSTFHDHWVQCRRIESRSYAQMVGCVEDGCYYYCSFALRPFATLFLRWEDIEHIYIQDGQNHLALALYSFKHGHVIHLQAQNDMNGFQPFVQGVSKKFFNTPDYLERKFILGDQPVRKLQVWPEERLV